MALCLKAYPDIIEKVGGSEHAKAYALWLLLNALDLDGCGSVPLEKARREAVKQGLFYGDGSAIDRRFRQGKRLGWFSEWQSKRQGRMIAYTGVAKVCQMLGIPRLRRAAVKMPLDALQSDQALRAYGLAIFYMGRDRKPIKRANTEKATGAKRSTQRNYEKLAGIEVVGQVSREPYQEGAVVNRDRAEYCYKDKTGQVVHIKPMANVYLTPRLSKCKPGRIRKVNRELREAGRLASAMEATKERASFSRLYYERSDQAMRAIERGIEWVLLRASYKHHKRGVWYRLPA